MNSPALIAGLGNPGAVYAETRHNVGFRVVERLAERWQGCWESSRRFRAETARVKAAGRVVWLCRPQTFMNLSGEAVASVARYHRVPLDQVMVVVDDADLPLGAVRLRGEGGTGGHHGLESVTECLGARSFARQRIGIGRVGSPGQDLSGHVLGRFGIGEKDLLDRALERAANQLESWLTDGLTVAMNRYNGTELNAET